MRPLSNMRRAVPILVAALALVAPGGAVAQSGYPNKPVRMVTGYAPGGTSDILARLMAQELARTLAQPVIAKNDPVAGSPEQFATFIRAEADKWAKIIRSARIQLD